MDTGQLSSTRTPACLPLSTAPSVDTTSCNFPLFSLFPRHLPEKDGSDPWRMPRMYWNHRWHHCAWLHRGRTWCLPTRSHENRPQIWLGVQPTEDTCESPSHQFFGCLYDANGVHPDPGKVDAVHALPAPTNITELQEFLGLVTYISPFIPGLSTLTAPLWELLKKDTDFSWNHTYDTTFEQIKKLSSVTPPSGTLTHHYPWQSKLMPHR